MKLDYSTYEQDIKNMCYKVNEQIIDSYNALKGYNFHKAYADSDAFLKKYNSIKEYIMKDRVFSFKYHSLSIWVKLTHIMKILESVNNKGISVEIDSPLAIFRKTYITSLRIYERKNNIIEKIKINKIDLNGDLNGIEGFSSYCVNKYIDHTHSIEDLISVFADLPLEMKRAYKDFKNPSDSEVSEKPYTTFLDEVNRKISNYKDSVDFIELYKQNPQYFLENFDKIPENEQEEVIKKLLKNTNFQANKKVDNLISEKYGDLIAKVFRKSVKR